MKKGYLDDMTFADSPTTLLHWLPIIIDRLRAINIELNLIKCELIVPLGTLLTELETHTANSIGITIIYGGSAKLLGGAIGGTNATQWPIIEKKLGDIEIFFRRLSSPLLDSRLAYTLLRSCGAPKANYLCMTHEPVLLNPFYTRMDHAQRQCFSAIAGSDTNIFSESGGGLTEYAVLGPILRSNTLADINGQRRTSTRPPQHSSHATLTNPFAAAHEKSAVGLHAGAWMTFGNSQLSGREFACALQLRCQAWPADMRYCTCGFAFSAAPEGGAKNYSHILTCVENTYTYQGRHEEIVTSCLRFLDTWAFTTKHEPKDLHGDDDEQRPDFTVFTPKVSPVIDVSIVTNFAVTYAGMSDPAAVIVDQKNKKHRANVESAGCYAFYALVGEASGRCHGNIDALARYLAQFVDATLRKQFRKEFVVEFAVALMRGNARIVSHALDRIRTGKIFGHPRCY